MYEVKLELKNHSFINSEMTEEDYNKFRSLYEYSTKFGLGIELVCGDETVYIPYSTLEYSFISVKKVK